MKDPPSYQEFNNSPFRYSALAKAGIRSYWPARGIIEASPGDTIKIELKTDKSVNDFCITETPAFGSPFQSFDPAPIKTNEALHFTYPVTPATGEWLYIFYEDEAVLRYKLNIRKEIKLAAVRR